MRKPSLEMYFYTSYDSSQDSYQSRYTLSNFTMVFIGFQALDRGQRLRQDDDTESAFAGISSPAAVQMLKLAGGGGVQPSVS